ncbi:response regulator [Leptolyngbya sp. 7M]|uniref:response regulator n=1 Tax=Leptolyngbya sp. 7M TaxID=2812896 RepID=UPI001B8D2875|nr:response regulator [Leptolyngbya sp. 7M]QYO66671.1 response regulator [Leptolyngbya sp. 7M]
MKIEVETLSPSFASPVAVNAINEHKATDQSIDELLSFAIRKAQSGERPEARAALFRVTEADPKNENAWLWLASISEYPEELLIFLNNVLEINPENQRAIEWKSATNALLSKTFVQRGIEAAEAEKRDVAIECFNRALEFDSENETAWLWMASLAETSESRINFLEMVLEINPSNASALKIMSRTKDELTGSRLQNARSAAAAGNNQDALAIIDEIIKENDDCEDAWFLRSHLVDSFTEKTAALERVVEINPGNEAALITLRSIYSLLGLSRPHESETTSDNAGSESSGSFFSYEPDNDRAPTQELEIPEAIREEVADLELRSGANTEKEEQVEDCSDLSDSLVTEDVSEIAALADENTSELVAEPGSAEAINEELRVYQAEMLAMDTADMEPDVVADIVDDTEYVVDADLVADAVAESGDSTEVPSTEPAIFYLSDEILPSQKADLFSPPQDSTTELNEEVEALTDDDVIRVVGAEHYASPTSETVEFNAEEYVESIDDPFAQAADETYEDQQSGAYVFNGNDEADAHGHGSEGSEHIAADVDVPRYQESNEELSLDPVTLEFPSAYQDDPDSKPESTFEPIAEEFNSSQLSEQIVIKAAESDATDPFKTIANLDGEEVAVSFESNEKESTLLVPEKEELAKDATEEFDHAIPLPVENSERSCAFCRSTNDASSISCRSCLAVLTVSDLDLVINNRNADRWVIRNAVEKMELESKMRPFNETELTMLAIGHLNLQNLDAAYNYLHAAARLNPDNVILESQANALLIRIEDLKKQDEAHGAMPKSKRILVVDDSPTVRKLIAGKLEKCGHIVSCASDGVEAIALAKDSNPDLVLLDINMPRMDGYQACKSMRNTPATANVPIVMISGKDGFFDKIRGKMAGCSGYISKPFGPETLMRIVEEHLAGKAVSFEDDQDGPSMDPDLDR